jgi:hypothetical protein
MGAKHPAQLGRRMNFSHLIRNTNGKPFHIGGPDTPDDASGVLIKSLWNI